MSEAGSKAAAMGEGGAPGVARAKADGIVAWLRNWAIERALPLWGGVGFDRVRGGFQERLNRDGTPDLAAPRRLRVQARQIYVYAHAEVTGWYPAGRRLALAAADFMLAKYRSPDGRPGFVHALAADGSLADARRDCYDHMFVLLALAWATRMSGDAQLRAALDDTLAFVDEHLTAPDGSLIEGVPASLPRRQNPHMHAFESMLALHETIAHREGLPRARRLHELMQTRFLDAPSRTIAEYFTDDWRRAAGAAGRCIEPGHHAEWTWLLRRYERLTEAPAGPLASQLLATALRFADPATGLLIDEADSDGSIRRASRRAWPQTELAKAWLAEAEAGVPGARARAADVLAKIAAHYLDRPVGGAWIDQFDASGQPVGGPVPASTLYHLFGAIAEADRVMGG